MSFEKQYCILPVCDGCGTDCWETEVCPHYASEREARRDLAAQYEWRIVRRIDGRFLMLCSRCADKADCEAKGHDWRPASVDRDSEQQARWEREHPDPLEMCHRCGKVRRDHAPAVALETVTAMSAEEREFLAGHPDLLSEEAL